MERLTDTIRRIEVERNNGYSVTFYPISTEEGRPSFVDNHIITEEDKAVLYRLHMEINKQYVTSSSKEFLEEKFANNFFCCCFESGVALFRFTPTSKNILINGVFVKRKQMRTLWNLFLPYMVYMFVGNKFRVKNLRDITLDELIDECNNAVDYISDDDIDLANEIINTLQQRKTPFSFAWTRLPNSMIVADIENLAKSSSDASIVSNIVFDRSVQMNAKAIIMQRYPESFRLRFCMTTAKEFIALCTEEIKTLCDKRFRKDFLKKLNDIDSKLEKVWFFCYSETAERNYYVQITGNTETFLNRNGGMIPVYLLISEMKKANQEVINRRYEYTCGPQKIVIATESYEDFFARKENQSSSPTGISDQMPAVTARSSVEQDRKSLFKRFKK